MTLDQEVDALREVPMFRGVDRARLKLLAFTGERVRFSPGQKFFAQGDASDAAYLILDGRAAIELETPRGSLRVAQVARNDLVGEMGLLSDAPRSATVIADDATTALKIDKRVFLDMLEQFPQLALAVMRELAKRLDRTNAQLAARAAG